MIGFPSPARAQTTEGQRWSFSATVGEAHAGNLLLLSRQGAGDTVDTVSTALFWGRSAARLSLSAYGRISGNYYRTSSRFNRLNYGGGFGASLHPSTRVSLVLGQSASSGFYAPLLLGLGPLLLPQAQADAVQTTGIGTWLAASRTTLKLDSGFSYLHYSSDVSALDPAQLPIGTLVLVGIVPPEQAGLDISDLPTPVDASVAALGAISVEGVNRQSLDVITFRAGMQVSQALTPKTSASLQLGGRGIDYSRTDLASGGQLDVGGSIQQRLGSATQVTLQYTYQRNAAQVPAVGTQTLLLQAQRELGPHLKADASVGFGTSSAAGAPSTSGSSLLGGGGLSGWHRRTSFRAHYGRSLFQALGFGRNYVSDYATASVDQTFTKRLSAGIAGQYRHSSDAFNPQFSFAALGYGASVGYRIQRRTQATAYYTFRHVRSGQSQGVDGSLWGFSLGYARAWK
jgi:hypothetical protein